MSTVDIVTTTYYKNSDKLKRCIETLTDKTKYVDYKWYIWANLPDDKMKKIIDDAIYLDGIIFNDRIEPVFNDNNDGSFSSNNNQAAAEGNGDYILFANDDLEVINDTWLYSMVNILDTDEKVGAVGSLLLYPDQSIQHCGVFFSHKTNNLPFHIHYKKPTNAVLNYINKPRYYQAVTGACMLVRRKDFEAVGGFDGGYFFGFEDVSLCLKLKKQLNKYCVYTPSAQLIHHEGISGEFKNHPKLQENIKLFKEQWLGQYRDDLDFYLNDPNFMIYKPKISINTSQLDESDGDF